MYSKSFLWHDGIKRWKIDGSFGKKNWTYLSYLHLEIAIFNQDNRLGEKEISLLSKQRYAGLASFVASCLVTRVAK
jgi:hypothetical protein